MFSRHFLPLVPLILGVTLVQSVDIQQAIVITPQFGENYPSKCEALYEPSVEIYPGTAATCLSFGNLYYTTSVMNTTDFNHTISMSFFDNGLCLSASATTNITYDCHSINYVSAHFPAVTMSNSNGIKLADMIATMNQPFISAISAASIVTDSQAFIQPQFTLSAKYTSDTLSVMTAYPTYAKAYLGQKTSECNSLTAADSTTKYADYEYDTETVNFGLAGNSQCANATSSIVIENLQSITDNDSTASVLNYQYPLLNRRDGALTAKAGNLTFEVPVPYTTVSGGALAYAWPGYTPATPTSTSTSGSGMGGGLGSSGPGGSGGAGGAGGSSGTISSSVSGTSTAEEPTSTLAGVSPTSSSSTSSASTSTSAGGTQSSSTTSVSPIAEPVSSSTAPLTTSTTTSTTPTSTTTTSTTTTSTTAVTSTLTSAVTPTPSSMTVGWASSSTDIVQTQPPSEESSTFEGGGSGLIHKSVKSSTATSTGTPNSASSMYSFVGAHGINALTTTLFMSNFVALIILAI